MYMSRAYHQIDVIGTRILMACSQVPLRDLVTEGMEGEAGNDSQSKE